MQIEELLRQYAKGERNFSGVYLHEVHLYEADLIGANLFEADLITIRLSKILFAFVSISTSSLS